MVDGGYPKIDYVMEREGLDKVCKHAVGMKKDDPSNPHRHEVRVRKPINDDITDVIGNTPMVRINNITKAEGIKCELCKSISSLIFILHSG
jgi:hypothetical protein